MEPVVQEAEQIAHAHCLAVLHPVDGLLELRQQTLVLGAVPCEAGEAMLLQQLLFAPEVHARELDELVQQFVGLRSLGVVYRRQAKFVHRVHHDGVLIVHGLHAHAAGMVPREKKSHMILRESRRLSAQAMLTAQVAAMGYIRGVSKVVPPFRAATRQSILLLLCGAGL
jgi:hypothetical protein